MFGHEVRGVLPAEAGVQLLPDGLWIPAYAGMTMSPLPVMTTWR
jgi:hypothetical protein